MALIRASCALQSKLEVGMHIKHVFLGLDVRAHEVHIDIIPFLVFMKNS